MISVDLVGIFLLHCTDKQFGDFLQLFNKEVRPAWVGIRTEYRLSPHEEFVDSAEFSSALDALRSKQKMFLWNIATEIEQSYQALSDRTAGEAASP